MKEDKEYVIPLDKEKLEEASKQIQQAIWPECVEPSTLKEVLEYVKEHLEENYEEYLQGAVDSTACDLDCGCLKLIYNHILELQERIDKAVEYINKFDQIKAYFEYVDEDGYDEYNYDENFKNDILEILKGDE